MPEITDQLTNALTGRYRIERHVGEGGMASVYLAHDVKHERKVALKVLRPELAAVIGGERFLNEIKVTANLQHPHILPLHDSGEADGFLFYVMPFVEDDTLRDKLDRERQLGIEEAVEITRSIASALDYAHRQGVIHRDIKPANILMHEGQPMIADFGIALAVSQASDQRLTETGLSIGTPHYMSPEQAMGDRQLGPRSDVYSLGAMLYEMIAGHPPYDGGTAQAIVAKVITSRAAPLRESRDTVPMHVEAAVAKALHKSPADRFVSAADFAKALADPGFTLPVTAQTTVVGPATAAPALSRRSTVLVTAAAAVVAVAAFLLGRLSTPDPTLPVVRFEFDAAEGVTVISECCGPQETLSPDGEWIVYTGNGGGDGRDPLFRRRLGQLEAEEIPGTDDASMPTFSPDGKWVAFWSDGRLRKVAMAGGPAVPIADVEIPDGIAWNDDDIIVMANPSDGPVLTVPASGGTPAPVPNTDPDHYYNHPSPVPGGGAVLLRAGGGINHGDARVVALDLETGAADTLAFGTRALYASGYLLISSPDGTLLAQPFDPARRETLGPAVAVLDGVATAGPGVGEFALSATGLAFQTRRLSSSESLVIHGPTGAAPVALPQDVGLGLEGPSFSPYGRRIAFQLSDGGEAGIWVWDRDQLTQELMVPQGRSAVWTSDGTRIAFGLPLATGEVNRIDWVPVDGSAPPEVLIEVDHVIGPSSFSPDDAVLAFRAVRDGDRDIGFLDVASGEVRWFVEDDANESQPIISPDGRWVAYTSDRSGQLEVYLRAFDGTGGRTQISAGGGHSPRWAPTGDAIYYASEEGRPTTLVSIATGGGNVRVLRREESFSGIQDLNNTTEVNWDVGPAGDEFVYISRGRLGGRPGFIWIVNWPEIVKRMVGGR